MTRWIVFEPPAGKAEGEAPVDRAVFVAPSDGAVFVKDAFAKWAVLFPFLWLFRHGLVLSGLLVLSVSIGLGLLAERPGLGLAAAVLPLLLGVFVALEGPSLRARRYVRKGYAETAVVDAPDEEEAAILYFSGAAAPAGRRESVAAAREPAPRPAGRAAFFEARLLRAEGRSLLDPAKGR